MLTHWYWQDLAQEIANDIYHQSRLCRAPKSKKVKMALTLELSGILWWNFAYTMILTRSNPRDCEITFVLGRGFAELQILKKWKWPYLLNWVICSDEILHTHWYWQGLAQEIAKWILLLVEALPSSEFWKSENGPISWIEWNKVLFVCVEA